MGRPSLLLATLAFGGQAGVAVALQHEHAGRRPLAPLHDQALGAEYNEHRFRRRVDKALESVRKILASTRAPTYAEATPHVYADKYALAEFVTATSIAAQFNVLEWLELSRPQLQKLASAAADGQSVTMRFSATERTEHVRESTRDVGDGHVHRQSSIFGVSESQVVRRVTEHFWRHEVQYEITVFSGAHPTVATTELLQRRTARAELVTMTAEAPEAATRAVPPIDAELGWLLRQLDASLRVRFQIDRLAPACKTPRRNAQIDEALRSAAALHRWSTNLHNYFATVVRRLPTPDAGHGKRTGAPLDFDAIAEAAEALFVPVLPLFENRAHNATLGATSASAADADAAASAGSVTAAACASPLVPALSDVHAFLAEQRRTLRRAAATIDATFQSDAGRGEDAAFSAAEAKLCVWSRHMRDVLAQYSDSIEYVEAMLRNQLASAIGRELSGADFARFMVQHEARLYARAHAPRAFTFAVRRPAHAPEGEVAIEGGAAAVASGEPIRTISRELDAPADRGPMSFALNAATHITFGGERHVHAYLAHQFGRDAPPPLRLTARARQFSAFLMLLGRLGPARTFEPSHALIVRDKDELTIPLLLEPLPTPQAFRDAIGSLSPEQQRFARAVRAVQLEGTVFGVLLLQLKPQLERLLNLPPESLTKQIALTRSLLDLFTQHQIPPDLLSYDGDASANTTAKLAEVRMHVQAITDMIGAAKADEVAASKQRAAYRHAESVAREGDAAAADDDAPVTMEAAFEAAPRVKTMARRSATLRHARMAVPVSAASALSHGATPPTEAAGAVPNIADAPTPDAPKPAPARPIYRPTDGKPDTEGPPPPSQPPSASAAVDFTALPRQLEEAYEAMDTDAAIRPTRIAVGGRWARRAQATLLAPPLESVLDEVGQRSEKQRAFDLLDALSRSGALPFDAASLHVLFAATHRFEESLTETVIAGNVNPIEKLENSSLIIASIIHRAPRATLVHRALPGGGAPIPGAAATHTTHATSS